MVHPRTLVLAGVTGLAALVATLPATAMQGPPSSAKPGASQDFPPFEKISEGFTEVAPADGGRGLYRLWVNEKTQKTLAELPRNFEKQDLFLAWTVAAGVETSAVQTGDQYAKWKRFGKRLALIEPNFAVVSTGDKQSQDATQRVFTDRVILEIPIMAMGPGGGPVIDLNGLFVNQASRFFGGVASGANTRLVTVEKAKTFPSNVELCYEMPLSSGRFAKFYYSIATIPSNTGYKPREADDRVGFFTTSIQDLGDPAADTPWKRYINRWQLEKADPKLQMSPPKKPIVFYIEHTVPVRYRRWVRDAILEWNTAFEEVGIVNAVEVYQQDANTGAHMEKDPEDARYNFMIWTNANMGFAIGPSRVNPRTGQILDADIVMDEGFVSSWVDAYERQIPNAAMESLGSETIEWLVDNPQFDPRVILADPQDREEVTTQIATRFEELRGEGLRAMHPSLDGPGRLIAGAGPDGIAIESNTHACTACQNAMRKSMDVAFMRMNAEFLGMVNPEDNDGQMLDGVPEEFIGPLLKEVIMHEVGHTLGLRHNFVGSELVSYEEMNSEGFDGPISSSVMDYLPVNIAFGDDVVQGPWTTTELGPYDLWAISYGYTPGKTDAILARCGEPELRYLTDEDTSGPDPMARRFDHAKNPLDYVDAQLAIVEELRGRIIEEMVEDGESWAKARQAYMMLLSKHLNAVGTAGNWIGGTTINRVKKGAELDPITDVPADQQRRALAIVLDATTPDAAYGLNSDLLRKMTVEKWFDGGGIRSVMADPTFDVHNRIGGVQRTALTLILNPTTLNRMYDNEYRAENGEDVLTIPETMDAVKAAVWTELDARPDGKQTNSDPYISSLRRNLQRAQLERMVSLAGGNNRFGASGTAVASLSRQQLRELDEQIGEVLSRDGSRLDSYSKAHLNDAKAVIDRVLNADYVYN